jgi:ribosomal protein S18 acetylase RimI-like enzyme
VADVRGVFRVNRAGWRTAYDHIVPDDDLPAPGEDPDEERVRRSFRRYAGAEDACYLVAEVDDEVVGFALCRWDDDAQIPAVGDGDVYLQALYVAPEHWEEGVGTALLRAVGERLPSWARHVVLEAFSENERAAAFYRARGFEPVGENSFEHRGTAYPTTVWRLPVATLRAPAE